MRARTARQRAHSRSLIVLAADISPMDILTHIPLLAEESGCAYVWVTSKELLGLASSTKRPTSCVRLALLWRTLIAQVMIVPQVKPPGPNSKAAKVVIDAEKQAEIDEYKQARRVVPTAVADRCRRTRRSSRR